MWADHNTRIFSGIWEIAQVTVALSGPCPATNGGWGRLIPDHSGAGQDTLELPHRSCPVDFLCLGVGLALLAPFFQNNENRLLGTGKAAAQLYLVPTGLVTCFMRTGAETIPMTIKVPAPSTEPGARYILVG